MVTVGVGVNKYVEDLLTFGQAFVDSKKRQLRFSAFAVASRICSYAPWTTIAVIKRAFRTKPHNGFCANLEAIWEQFPWNNCLELLEDLLRYFHTTCKEPISKLKPQARNKLLTNIDICATENFLLKAQSMKKIKADDIKSSLLGNTTKFLTSMEVTASQLPTPDRAWIITLRFVGNDESTCVISAIAYRADRHDHRAQSHQVRRGNRRTTQRTSGCADRWSDLENRRARDRAADARVV